MKNMEEKRKRYENTEENSIKIWKIQKKGKLNREIV
jgi:hypothetical protein